MTQYGPVIEGFWGSVHCLLSTTRHSSIRTVSLSFRKKSIMSSHVLETTTIPLMVEKTGILPEISSKKKS